MLFSMFLRYAQQYSSFSCYTPLLLHSNSSITACMLVGSFSFSHTRMLSKTLAEAQQQPRLMAWCELSLTKSYSLNQLYASESR